jgi:pimeloyl-ACP methyl ester carboxylesterase
MRIERTRWPDHVAGSGWDYGTDPEYLRSLLATWADEFDWRKQERELNRLAHHRADIDGRWVHFVHERGDGPAPLPIVLTHGFPSSFVEHLDLLPLLTDPAAHGGTAEDAFDVVVASLPGYGFSDPPIGPMLEGTVADLWCRLMRDGLGYTRFGAHGSDVGSGVTIQLGLRHPDHLIGIHLSAFYLEPPPEPWPPVVREFIERQGGERAEDVASHEVATSPPSRNPSSSQRRSARSSGHCERVGEADAGGRSGAEPGRARGRAQPRMRVPGPAPAESRTALARPQRRDPLVAATRCE